EGDGVGAEGLCSGAEGLSLAAARRSRPPALGAGAKSAPRPDVPPLVDGSRCAPERGQMRPMPATRHAVVPALPIVLSLAVSCGGRSRLPEPIPACPEPASAEPDPGSLVLEQGPYDTSQVTLHNQCEETIWPAWTRTGGLDGTVLDPSLWAPLSPG